MWFKRRKKAADGKASMLEQRRSYRMAPAEQDPLFVHVKLSSGPPLEGELVDISDGGAAVGFSTGVDPGLEEGAPVTLTVSSEAHGEVLATAATVSSRVSVDKRRVRYGFEFDDRETLLRTASPALLTLLNRRHHERLWAALTKSLVATLHCTPTQSFHVQVHDLSPDGIGFLVNDLQADLMETVGTFEVELRIPRTDTVLRWQAVVSHVSPLPSGGTLCGLAFQDEGTAAHQRARQELAAYCASRAGEMARWKSA